MGYIIDDTGSEVLFGSIFGQFVEDGFDHGRGELFGRQTIASASNHRHGFERSGALDQASIDGGHDVQEERFTDGTRFLGAVHDSDLFDGSGQYFEESGHIEGTVQTHVDNASLAALFVEVFGGFFCGFSAGAHDHDHFGGIGSADVVEDVIGTAGDFGKLIHGLLDDGWDSFVIFVAGFAALEVSIRVLGSTANEWSFWVQSAFANFIDLVLVHHGADFVHADLFDLSNFGRSTEAIEEVQEGNAAFKGGDVGDQGVILSGLDGVGSQQSETGLPGSHDI